MAAAALAVEDPASRSRNDAEIQCVLFDARGNDRDVDTSELATLSPSENQLLWVDVRGLEPGPLQALIATLGFPKAVSDSLTAETTDLRLRNHGDFFELRVIAVSPGK